MAEGKYQVHVRTEQYGFISYEADGSAEEAVQSYNDLKREYTRGKGLPSREFCAFMDYYVNKGTPPENGIIQWEAMSNEQKFVINELKKCFNRINKK